MKTLLFDLDGTLTDPRVGIIGSIRYALEKLDLPVSSADQDYFWCIGPPLLESFVRISGDATMAEKAVKLYRERFSETGLFENRVYDGIPNVLSALSETGHPLFLATSKPQVFAEKILDHFNLSRFFDQIYGSELDGTRSKKSDLLGYIVRNENLAVENCIMIGDRMHDVEGARSNQIVSIGVLYGFGGREELEQAGADRLCESPANLPATIQSFG